MSAAVEDRFAKLIGDERHFESINIWRSANGETIRMMPLAVCASPSVKPADIVFGDGQNTGNIRQYMKVVDQRLIHGPHQRWYYFPDMTPDEVLLLRQYDTRKEPAHRLPHGSSRPQHGGRRPHAHNHRSPHATHPRPRNRQAGTDGPVQGPDPNDLRRRPPLQLVEWPDRELRPTARGCGYLGACPVERSS